MSFSAFCFKFMNLKQFDLSYCEICNTFANRYFDRLCKVS